MIAGLPWEVVVWAQRKPGRRVEREASGAIVLIEALATTDARARLNATEVRRFFPSLTAACAAVAL